MWPQTLSQHNNQGMPCHQVLMEDKTDLLFLPLLFFFFQRRKLHGSWDEVSTWYLRAVPSPLPVVMPWSSDCSPSPSQTGALSRMWVLWPRPWSIPTGLCDSKCLPALLFWILLASSAESATPSSGEITCNTLNFFGRIHPLPTTSSIDQTPQTLQKTQLKVT